MKAVCDTCGARYRIPDEKAAGKVLQIRCRKCGNVFKFEGTGAPSPVQTPKGEWFFAIDGDSFGPYTERELRTRFESGKLGLDTHVWKEGFSDWLPVIEHPKFAAAIELSKDNIRRLGAQSPQSTRTTEGSGRFTVDIRRPGATVDDSTQAQRDALDDEVDNAFQSLMGRPKDKGDAQDDLTPTKPMRVSAAQNVGTTNADKTQADDAHAETVETTRPIANDTRPAARASSPASLVQPTPKQPASERTQPKPTKPEPVQKRAPSRPTPARTSTPSSKSPRVKAAAPPQRKSTSSPSDKRLSLSERLRRIREQSEGGGESKSELPTRTGATPAAATKAPADIAPTADAPAIDATQDTSGATPQSSTAVPTTDDQSTSASIDTATGAAPQDTAPSDTPPAEAKSTSADTPSDRDDSDASDSPIAPIPSGPIRHATQELDTIDIFEEDAPALGEPAPAVAVPSDEDLQAHLHRRKEARARGEELPASSDDDAPPFVLANDLPQKTPSTAKQDGGQRAAATPYSLDGTPDSHDDEPPYVLDSPAEKDPGIRQEDVTPVGGTAAVPAAQKSRAPGPVTAAHDAAQHKAATPQRFQKKLLILILILALFLLLVLAGWLVLRDDGDIKNAASATDAEETVDLDANNPVDRTNVLYARNQALGIVARSRSAAKSAAFVATEDTRNANQRQPRRTATQRSNPSRNAANTRQIEFTTAGSTRASVGSNRQAAASSGPSKALFANTLQSAVGRSVGRCAQRTIGVEGFLPVARLELSITINPDGTVDRVRGQREAHSGPLMRCISTESQRWSFPSFKGKKTTITHPFVLQ